MATFPTSVLNWKKNAVVSLNISLLVDQTCPVNVEVHREKTCEAARENLTDVSVDKLWKTSKKHFDISKNSIDFTEIM